MARFVLASSSTWSLDTIRLDELAAEDEVSKVHRWGAGTGISLEADRSLVLCSAEAWCSTFFFLGIVVRGRRDVDQVGSACR